MNQYWKDLLAKAGFAAFYGAVSEFAVTQTLDKNSLLVALVSAALRALIIFATTIKEELDKKKSTAVRSKSVIKKSWKSNL
jgi:hypothetical protein